MACQTLASPPSSQNSTNNGKRILRTDLSRWTQIVCTTREVKPDIVFCYRILKPVSLVRSLQAIKNTF